MRPSLLPCPSCQRHVKSGARACPFCDAALAAPYSADVVPDTRGWKRAAVFTFGLAMANCGGSTTGSTGDATPPDAIADTTLDTANDTAADQASEAAADVVRDVPADDNGGVAPPYGIPPKDAGVPNDDGSIKADYGAPPPPDASADR